MPTRRCSALQYIAVCRRCCSGELSRLHVVVVFRRGVPVSRLQFVVVRCSTLHGVAAFIECVVVASCHAYSSL